MSKPKRKRRKMQRPVVRRLEPRDHGAFHIVTMHLLTCPISAAP